jgi:uncharacterized damage-inducible protein DinB
MGTLLDDLFRQNEWANLRLIEACRALTDEQLDTAAVGAYGTIRGTLVHLVRGEPSYVTRIGGVYDGPAVPRDDAGFPGFALLEEAVRAAAAGLIERASTVDAEPFAYREQDGEEVDAAVVLVQALNHGTEHRGQICTILTALGVTPPELDGWTWGVATGRIREP